MILFALIVFLNVVALSSVLLVFVLKKTNILAEITGVISNGEIEEMAGQDADLVGRIGELSSLSKLARASIDDRYICLAVAGYDPLTIDPDLLPNLRDLFSIGSANRIAYNAFDIHREFIRLFQVTGDNKFVDLFWQAYRQWNSNLFHSLFDDYAWYDHCVAARLVNLRYCTLVLLESGKLTDRQHTELLKRTIAFGDFVASNKRYDWVTNHGLIMDNFLLHAAVAFPESSLKNVWINRVVERAVARVDHFISDDGVPLEGSTTYWYLIHRLYDDIMTVLDREGIALAEEFRAKVAKCRAFLIDTNIHGLINRLGDSSGGHEIAALGNRPTEQDGYYLNVCDSGLVYMNGVKEKKVVTQLFFNVQNVPPYVHRHEDALSVGLYHDKVFWINSPGSYSADRSSLATYVKSCRNQSICFSPIYRYRHNCRLEVAELDDSHFVLVGFVDDTKGAILKRTISFDLADEQLVIEDASEDASDVRSQFLLSPNIRVEPSGQNEVLLRSDNSSLRLVSDQSLTLESGKVSYKKNKLVDAGLLVVNSPSHSVRVPLNNGLSHLQYDLNIEYRHYSKRQLYRSSRVAGIVSRLHLRRFRQLLIIMAGELTVVAVLIFIL